MTAAIRAELYKLGKRPGVLVILVVWPLLGLLFGYVLPYSIRNNEALTGIGDITSSLLPDQFVANAIQGFPQFGFALAIILGGLAVGSEYGWKTVGATVVQRPARYTVYAGRLLALAFLALVLTLSTFVIAAMTSVVMANLLNETTNWPDPGEIGLGLGGGWLILTVGVLIGATLAVVLRSTALAVGLGLVYALVVESLFAGFASSAGWVDAIARYLPGVNSLGIAGAFQDDNPSTGAAAVLVSGTHATTWLLIYLTLLCLIGLLVFQRRDIAE